MKKNPLILALIGLLLLAIGTVMQFTGGPPQADMGLVQRCQTEMNARAADADMVAKCSDVAFATAVTATDAEAAARSISAANNSEIGGNMVAMFLIGLGLAMALGGAVMFLKQKR